MPFGWSGQILRIDVSTGESWTEDSEQYTRSFIGGRGINVKILYDDVDPGVLPLDPANELCFGPGVLTGTLAPTASRMEITSVSPNGLIGNAGIGGFIGAEIRHAGYDNVIVQGRAEKPAYLYIHNESVQLMDALHLWGKDTQETQRAIRDEVGGAVELLCIGPGGENLVSFSSIVTGLGSVAGRHGLGAIMGSKNLKAIAVRGSRDMGIARLEEFLAACEEARHRLRTGPGMQRQAVEGVGDKYTLGSGLAEDTLGNWEVEGASWEEFGGYPGAEEFWDQYAVHQYGCFGCPVNHFHVFRDEDVGMGVVKCMGWGGFGSNVWNPDRKLMFHASHLCNKYGLDITATGNAVSFLMELYHRGIITEKDTDGLPMRRGDAEAVLFAIHRIGEQKGFGKLFRNGVHEAAVKIGGEAAECAMVVKGEEIEQYELRAFKSMALTAALNAGSVADGLSFEYAILRDREAQDAIARYAKEHYGSGDVLRPNSYKKKGLIVSDYENLRIALDLLGMCRWAFASTDGTSLDTPAALFSLATGRDISPDDLLRAASRTKTLERAFNVRKGIGRGDDTLPKRMFETAVPGGRWAGASLNREKFDRMLDEYYAARTWDKDGAPTAETFAQFGLESEWQAFVEHSPHKSSPAEDLVDDG